MWQNDKGTKTLKIRNCTSRLKFTGVHFIHYPKFKHPPCYMTMFQNVIIGESQEELAKLVRQHDEVLGSETKGPHQHCLSPRELLTVYGLARSDPLEPVSFLHLCPAIVYQLDLGSCATQSHLLSDTSSSTTQSSKIMIEILYGFHTC